ncbi:helix-turn-helix transcriptional regulator [Leucobacter sp. CSA1]|uniref:Helix-turn-helix transcriptional regulator n=1 Tax=Leucobacter chromiisoli TaxID=2796471 RepID=A0A934UU99_9MICO|nr:helix-turn-helix transcriptional regulator [Leucobacter chromiisoli]MBK0418595.1 helix-turn-helix transcriptional regulator [Leucobacter chromiisoli]
MDIPLSRLPARAVGARVREIRLALGISQNDLAELALLHSSNLGKIERGEANPNLDTLTRIATALNTTVSDLTRYVTAEHVAPRERRVTAADLIRARGLSAEAHDP